MQESVNRRKSTVEETTGRQESTAHHKSGNRTQTWEFDCVRIRIAIGRTSPEQDAILANSELWSSHYQKVKPLECKPFGVWSLSPVYIDIPLLYHKLQIHPVHTFIQSPYSTILLPFL